MKPTRFFCWSFFFSFFFEGRRGIGKGKWKVPGLPKTQHCGCLGCVSWWAQDHISGLVTLWGLEKESPRSLRGFVSEDKDRASVGSWFLHVAILDTLDIENVRQEQCFDFHDGAHRKPWLWVKVGRWREKPEEVVNAEMNEMKIKFSQATWVYHFLGGWLRTPGSAPSMSGAKGHHHNLCMLPTTT